MIVLFSEYDNPAFRLEEKYVQLAHSLKDYFSILIKKCKIWDKKIPVNDGPLLVHVYALLAWLNKRSNISAQQWEIWHHLTN